MIKRFQRWWSKPIDILKEVEEHPERFMGCAVCDGEGFFDGMLVCDSCGGNGFLRIEE